MRRSASDGRLGVGVSSGGHRRRDTGRPCRRRVTSCVAHCSRLSLLRSRELPRGQVVRDAPRLVITKTSSSVRPRGTRPAPPVERRHGPAATGDTVACGRSGDVVGSDRAVPSRRSAGRSVVAAAESPDSGCSEDGYERDACEVFLVDSHIPVEAGDRHKPMSSVAGAATDPLSGRAVLIPRWVY